VSPLMRRGSVACGWGLGSDHPVANRPLRFRSCLALCLPRLSPEHLPSLSLFHPAPWVCVSATYRYSSGGDSATPGLRMHLRSQVCGLPVPPLRSHHFGHSPDEARVFKPPPQKNQTSHDA